MKYPIKAIHQVELTSRCNLKCAYCVSKDLKRPKLDMDISTFRECLKWARLFIQDEFNLAGIGESTLHPLFVDFVALARKELGPSVALTMATNGLLMTPELARAIAPFKPMVWVSLHRPEYAGKAVEALKSANILAGVSADPSIAAMDWAGQVDWHISHGSQTKCSWLSTGRVMIMADGRVTTCCLDADGSGVIGHITDNIKTLTIRPFSLCEKCSLRGD